jgi:hypothetical protein
MPTDDGGGNALEESREEAERIYAQVYNTLQKAWGIV